MDIEPELNLYYARVRDVNLRGQEIGSRQKPG